MESGKPSIAACKHQLRELLQDMDNGSEQDAERLLESFVKSHEASLFNEIGRITRDLHDTLASFQMDSQMVDLAEKGIPDAKERLNYVITLTEQAANKVLSAVEESLPVSEALETHALKLDQSWKRFRQREMTVEDFRAMASEIDDFLGSTTQNASLLHANLSDMLLAQGFQDLTGQVIRRVITMVQEVEDSLVDLIRMTRKTTDFRPEKQQGNGSLSAPVGPKVPGVDTADHVSNQDDVDALLSSLGF